MSWKKNVFSYFIWLVYTLITGTVLVFLLSEITGTTTAGVIGTAIALIAAGGFVLLLHCFAPKYTDNPREKHTVRNVTEAAIAVVLLAVGLVLRIRGVDSAGQMAGYYELAEVATGQSIPQIAHGAVFFYVQILHTIFYFLGNKFTVGIGFQMILQYGAVLMLYYSMRHLSGHIAALVTLALVMCSPYMIQSSLLLSPEMFYLIFFMAALAWVVSGHMVKLRSSEFLFLGIMIAVLAFMDVAGLLLFFLAIAVILNARKENPSWKRKMISVVLCCLGLAAGFTGCVFADAWISEKSARGVFKAWIALYRPESFSLPLTLEASGSVMEYVVLFGLMSLGIFSFWRDKKRDHMGAYAIGICLVMTASAFGIFTNEMPGCLWLFLLFSMLAGISTEECFRDLPKSATEQKNEKRGEEIRKRQEIRKTEPCEKPEEKQLEDKPMEKTEPQKVKYIENPLPLPKKHEKRVLDYDVDYKEKDDDFDVAVADDDDFDI